MITINLLEAKLLENAITDNFTRTFAITIKYFTISIIGFWYYEKQEIRFLKPEEKEKNKMFNKIYLAMGILNCLIYYMLVTIV